MWAGGARACARDERGHAEQVTENLLRALHEHVEHGKKHEVLELLDGDLARLIKRVVRKPRSIKGLSVKDAVRVGEAMIETRSGVMLAACREARASDHRPGVRSGLEAAVTTRATHDFPEDVTRATLELLSDESCAQRLRSTRKEAELDTVILGEWMLQNESNTFDALHLDAAPCAMVLGEVLNGRHVLDVARFVQDLPYERREGVVAEVALHYRGPLTMDVMRVAARGRDQLGQWAGISGASDEMIQMCLDSPEANSARLSNVTVMRLVSNGIIDPWHMLEFELTPTQRAGLCMAAASIREWAVVNAVLCRWSVWSGSGRFSGGDLSTLLSMPGNEALVPRARRECMRFCSVSQLMWLVREKQRVNVEEMVSFLESETDRYCSDADFFSQDLREHEPGDREAMRLAVSGPLAGAALANASISVARVIREELTERMGDSMKRWRVALSLAQGWVGTLDELASAAVTIAG